MLAHYQVHHIGIAVFNIEDAVKKHVEAYGYTELEPRERLNSFKVEVAFLLPDLENKSLTALELISPLEGNTSLVSFLENRGEGLHHICYAVKSIKEEQAKLEALGYEFLDKEPRPGAHGAIVSFIHPSSCSGVLTELTELEH